MTISSPPLYGLVLAGGHSTRMQRDKAALRYHGQTQLEWAMGFIEPYVDKAYVSVRADQADDPVRGQFELITDTRQGLGPIGGIVAAQARYPEVAWLVIACDLPFLDADSLKALLTARDPQRPATAFRSSHDGLPEPLCAIWEPASRAPIEAYVGTGRTCPRKFLIRSEAHLIDEPNPRALDNINTPEEYGTAMTTLSNAPTRKNVKVQFYALLREQAGRSEEALVTGARTPRELYEELQGRYPFSLAPEMLRVAVNAEFGEWSQPLADGDSVVFIPPVAGG